MHGRRAPTTIDAKEIAMIPYDIDPSLHPAEPTPEKLGDGFSPPPHDAVPPRAVVHSDVPQDALGEKSDF
jgi:hypothetical protein